MTLSDVIIAKTENEITAINTGAASTEADLIKTSQIKSGEVLHETKIETDRQCREKYESARATADLESRMAIGNHREKLFRNLCASVLFQSCEKADIDFVNFICSILTEGSKLLRSQTIDAYLPASYEKRFADQNDAIFIMLKKSGINLREIIYNLSSIGGAVVRSEDKKRLLTNTLERRLQKIEDELREEFNEKLGIKD